MNKHFIFIIALLCAVTAHAQHYVPQDENSAITFSVVNHMMVKSTVSGTLQGLKGNITFDPANPKNAAFDVTVNTGTIKTGVDMRDNHLKKEEFFNTDKFPEIRIASTQVEAGKTPATYLLHGKLSMKGVTKDIDVPFTAVPSPAGILFKGSFTLNRLDYTVGEKGKIEDGVKVELSVLAKKGN